MNINIKKYSTILFGLLLCLGIARADPPTDEESVMIGNRVYSITTWKKGAAEGNAGAQQMLGLLYLEGKGVEKNVPLGLELVQKAALQGVVSAQEFLGRLYMEGNSDVSQDYVVAKKWFEMAADERNPIAQYNLGVIYGRGLGVDKNESKAKSWFAKACNNNLQVGCNAYQKISQQ